ncbi:General amino acid permease [Wickerhamomyces ciferrii]|uniref:General amino acid permease n=1 Tax=Wickerhamomyces ciferrii (strain ATCC 14091 / BCRC 22168 / CBS 111 / JCM 3599 / NBRC 0793 / NRRL Y-1031 F-60-10) TaxID=1206466 RepID=K0KIC0_WICCF|nr:General amino acid permease [Wickerhamomyces ciferrii]CCH41144.1 General amino acid permease [Wickerhamomyces ciferrii]
MTNSLDKKSSQQTSQDFYYNDVEKNGFSNDQQINQINEYSNGELDPVQSNVLGVQEGYRLKKHLKARHVSMIAIGGAIGTGLLIGSGSALSSSGPAPLFIGYTFVGLIVYQVMCCLGEIATYIPLPSGFNGYAERYADPSLGFAVGWCYLFKYLIVTPNQITAGALVLQYWVSRDKVNPGVWITIFIIIILLINIFGVKIFGEFEFWLSSLKVLIVLGLIILLFVIMLGGGPTHDRLGFRYWNEPGAFKPFKGIGGEDKAKFVSFVNVLVTAVFAYSGTELIGVTISEAANPRKSVPKAIKLTFYRIIVFYVCSVLLLGMCVPYNDPLLINASKASTSANASPFVVAIRNASIGKLDHVINGCILIFIFSAANSDLYIGSRTLYGLACNGNAPKIFAKTNKYGIPSYALAVCTAFCGLAYMAVSSSSQEVFSHFVNVVSIFGLLTWISILLTHIGFTRAMKAQGISKKTLAYTAPFQPWGTYIALFWCIVVCFIKNFTAFINGFNYKSFITGYIGIPVYVIAYFGYKIIKKGKIHRPEDVDLFTLKNFIDEEEEQGKIDEAERKERLKNGKKDLYWFYETFIGWLF